MKLLWAVPPDPDDERAGIWVLFGLQLSAIIIAAMTLAFYLAASTGNAVTADATPKEIAND